ncbi:hypothetical protein [Actibacterium ureilyticum]|uniref:hypothetical protein n=1 Tax=Actibacterium ureilyticum TaxID=1590614 RepID=UPI000BAAC81B|nr:hypothetical protein [Actibacterium ureilyticum]
MKPRFALNLSLDGIGLLHRAKRGWNLVGEASLDDADLSQTLHMLRETASALEAGGVRSKLIIPDSQILYTTLPPAPAGVPVDDHIRKGLEGLTPYDVSDLVYDWTDGADGIRLAVVARETLGEAEGFAAEHRFNPVSFVARPQEGQFPGEPFFGPTALAETLIDSAETLEPDTEAVAIHGRSTLPKTMPEPDAPVVAPALALAATDLVDPEPQDEAAPAEVDTPEPAHTPDLAPPPDLAAAPEPADAPDPAPVVAPVLAAPPVPPTPPAPTETSALALAVQDDPIVSDPEAEAALRAALSDPEDTDETVAADPVDIPAELAHLPLPTDPGGASAPGMLDVLASKSERLQALETGREMTPPQPLLVSPAAPETGAPRAPHVPPAPAAIAEPSVFGGSATPVTTGGKGGVLGWVLAMIVLLMIAAAALWAVLGLGGDTVEAPDGDITQIQTTALSPQGPETPVLPGDPAGAAPQAPRPAEIRAPDPVAETPAPEPQAPVEQSETPAPAAEPAAPPANDALDTAEPAQPGAEDFPQVELSALDSGRITGDLAAPPQRPDTERAFVPPLPDPVEPTAEGALSYRGVLVYAGRPPGVVAPRPQTAAPATAPEAPQDAAPVEQPNPQLARFRPVARPAGTAPADAAPDDAPETAPVTEAAPQPDTAPEDATRNGNIGGINWAALQQFRPQSRPAATPAALALVAPDAPTTETVQEDPAAPVSRLALAASPMPVARPRNFSQAVQRALKQVQPEVPLAKPVPAAAALTPRNPTVKSVANQATEANAIRLNRLNLIGVYGSTSDRRALVRLPSGRYVKLKIGDRLDGGKVAAIDERELHYIKGGRSIVLSMPKG